MGSIIKRKKRGPHTVTHNTRTGKITVSTSTRAGNVRTTRSISGGKTRTTQTTHFGDGLFSRTVKTTGGNGQKNRSGGSNWLSGLKGTTNNSSEEKESKPTVKLSTTAKVVWILIVMSVGIPLALWSKWIGVIFMAIMILPIASDSNE